MGKHGVDVVDQSNRRGRLVKDLDPREPRTAVLLDDGGEVVVPTDRLTERPGGGLRLTTRFDDVGVEPGESTRTILPVFEERLEVSKREVETGRLRLEKRVRDAQVVTVRREEVIALRVDGESEK